MGKYLHYILMPFMVAVAIPAGIIISWVGISVAIIENLFLSIKTEKKEYTKHKRYKTQKFEETTRKRPMFLGDRDPGLFFYYFEQIFTAYLAFPLLFIKMIYLGPKRIYSLLDAKICKILKLRSV